MYVCTVYDTYVRTYVHTCMNYVLMFIHTSWLSECIAAFLNVYAVSFAHSYVLGVHVQYVCVHLPPYHCCHYLSCCVSSCGTELVC